MKARLESMSKCHWVVFLGSSLFLFVLVAACSAAVPEMFVKQEGSFITCENNRRVDGGRILQKDDGAIHEDGLECEYLKDGHYWEAKIKGMSPKN